jgi:N-acetylglucosamine-6-phosphate deacetylase
MPRLHLLAKQLFDGETILSDQIITIDNGYISAVFNMGHNHYPQVDEVIDGLLVPGFIDLQVNGGGNILFNACPTVKGIKTIINAHAQFGTTAMLPTLITDKIEVMQQAADAIAQAIAAKVAGVIGIHFEGPHIATAKKGAHLSKYIRTISDAEWQILARKDLGQIVVTLAPEQVRTSDIKRMVDLGIKVCLGHTNATYQTAQQAINAGADGFTHLYNAMSPLQGREPGVVGAAFLNKKSYCGLIIDGHHVNYNSCQIAVNIKERGTVFLVTDAMPLVGSNECQFNLLGRKVSLMEGKLSLPTGELAGSVLDMATGVRNIYQQLNVPLEEALRMASLYPATYLNQSHIRGKLTVGAQADMVNINSQQEVQCTWIAGKKVYQKK